MCVSITTQTVSNTAPLPDAAPGKSLTEQCSFLNPEALIGVLVTSQYKRQPSKPIQDQIQ